VACSLFIAFYIFNEVSFDRFNSKKDRIYRLISTSKNTGGAMSGSWSAPVMGPTIAGKVPEIDDYLRMSRFNYHPVDITCSNQVYSIENLIQADSSFFNFFSIPVQRGDPASLLNGAHKLVVSESAAKKLFGKEEPLGRMLQLGTDTIMYTVSGVMADLPYNSHFEADIIVS